MARGALAIDPLELELELDGPDVVEAHLMGEPRAHALVEELMILANEQVAEHLQRVPPPGALPHPRAARARGHRGAVRALRRPRRADGAASPSTMGPQEAARAS